MSVKGLETILGNNRSAKDSPFQSEGPTTEKARFCIIAVWAKGTRRRPCSVERRERRSGIPMVVWQRSTDTDFGRNCEKADSHISVTAVTVTGPKRIMRSAVSAHAETVTE